MMDSRHKISRMTGRMKDVGDDRGNYIRLLFRKSNCLHLMSNCVSVVLNWVLKPFLIKGMLSAQVEGKLFLDAEILI